MKKNEQRVSDEVLALVGRTVRAALKTEGTVMPKSLTGLLQDAGAHSDDESVREECNRIISGLRKKMH